MNELIQRYIECRLPIIPLAHGTKCPVARGWDKNNYPAESFRNRNVGTRAGEWIRVDGKEGNLLIIDFDSPDLELLKRLCSAIPLVRTTCVRTGGEHEGYHLFYLTPSATRKRGMLRYREASIDLLGKGSFAVIPPSVVVAPYRFLVGLNEIAFMSNETYGLLLSTLQNWKLVGTLVKRVANQRLTSDKALEIFAGQGAAPEMLSYLQAAIDRVNGEGGQAVAES
jgi:hypothetical protein